MSALLVKGQAAFSEGTGNKGSRDGEERLKGQPFPFTLPRPPVAITACILRNDYENAAKALDGDKSPSEFLTVYAEGCELHCKRI